MATLKAHYEHHDDVDKDDDDVGDDNVIAAHMEMLHGQRRAEKLSRQKENM